jgi:hypothetical protein
MILLFIYFSKVSWRILIKSQIGPFAARQVAPNVILQSILLIYFFVVIFEILINKIKNKKMSQKTSN